METTQTKPIKTESNGTKPKPTETAVTVRFPLAMSEAIEMVTAYIQERYGLTLNVDDLNRGGDTLIVTGTPKAKGQP
jgi:hypothetical protein